MKEIGSVFWIYIKLTCVCYVLQFYVTYDLFIAAFAGAGITLLALVRHFFLVMLNILFNMFKTTSWTTFKEAVQY